MISRARVVVAALLLSACVGPRYHPAPVVPAGSKVGAGQTSDSTRSFFDSLRTARAADSGASPASVAPRSMAAESIADLAWLDILHDSLLDGLVATALRQNRDLAVAQGRIREFRAQAGVARASLFPSVEASATVSTNQQALGTLSFAYKAWVLTASAQWELDFWGRNRRGLQAASADLASQEAAAQATVLSLVSDVATGYLSLLELDQEQAVAEHTLSSGRSTLALARQRYAQGLTSELDVRRFEAQLAVPAIRLAQVEQLRAQQEHALSVLIGQGPTSIARGETLAAAAQAVVAPDSLPATLLERRPDVREAERAYAAATARVGVADAARLPTVMISGFEGTQAASTGELFTAPSKIYQLQGGISLPLFTGGRLVNEARAARARAEQARARYEQTALTALQEAGDALAGVRGASDEVAAGDTQVKALRRALELAQVRYQSGVANYFEVLDAEQQLFNAEIALSQSQLGQLTAAVRLYKALGGSWERQKRM